MGPGLPNLWQPVAGCGGPKWKAVAPIEYNSSPGLDGWMAGWQNGWMAGWLAELLDAGITPL